jgi:hypothetical protein
VAGGLVTIATGGDGGGSIRIPGGFCGLVGMKGTAGRIPRGPFTEVHPMTVVSGPMARSVRDVCRWYDVTSGYDMRDPYSLPKVEGWERDLATFDLRGRKAVIAPTLGVAIVRPEVEARVRAAGEQLARDAGLELVDVPVRLPGLGYEWALANLSQLLRALGDRWPACKDRLTVEIAFGLHIAEEQFNLAMMARCEEARTEANERMAEVFDSVDFIICATNPDVAFEADCYLNQQVGGQRVGPENNGALTIPANIVGNPAISVPIEPLDGLPVGMQIIGATTRTSCCWTWRTSSSASARGPSSLRARRSDPTQPGLSVPPRTIVSMTSSPHSSPLLNDEVAGSRRAEQWAATMTGHDAGPVRRAHRDSTDSLRVCDLADTYLHDRAEREARQHEHLAAGATRAEGAGTRAAPELPDPFRTCFERDRDRILHGATAFRRLAGKTQVFIFPEDHQRTRLTHALEVAQVATAIARAGRLNVALTEAIALGHDCGHGPEAMHPKTLLALSRRRVRPRRLGRRRGARAAQPVRRDARRHPQPLVVAPAPTTPEGEVVSWADRIAYVCHDFEDAVHAGIVTAELLPDMVRERCGDTRSRAARTRSSAACSTAIASHGNGRHGRASRRRTRRVPPLQLRAHLHAPGLGRPERVGHPSAACARRVLRRPPQHAPVRHGRRVGPAPLTERVGRHRRGGTGIGRLRRGHDRSLCLLHGRHAPRLGPLGAPTGGRPPVLSHRHVASAADIPSIAPNATIHGRSPCAAVNQMPTTARAADDAAAVAHMPVVGGAEGGDSGERSGAPRSNTATAPISAARCVSSLGASRAATAATAAISMPMVRNSSVSHVDAAIAAAATTSPAAPHRHGPGTPVPPTPSTHAPSSAATAASASSSRSARRSAGTTRATSATNTTAATTSANPAGPTPTRPANAATATTRAIGRCRPVTGRPPTFRAQVR